MDRYPQTFPLAGIKGVPILWKTLYWVLLWCPRLGHLSFSHPTETRRRLHGPITDAASELPAYLSDPPSVAPAPLIDLYFITSQVKHSPPHLLTEDQGHLGLFALSSHNFCSHHLGCEFAKSQGCLFPSRFLLIIVDIVICNLISWHKPFK